jgi:predicted O-methyltransferase YrrM
MEKNQLIEYVWSFGFGGMEKDELHYVYDLSRNKTILELGSEMGQSAYVMASVANSITCVDAWDDTYEHLNNDPKQKTVYLSDQKLYQDKEINKNDIFGQFKRNCKEFIDSGKLKYIKGKTLDVVNQFENESFDVILIDADHSYEGVYGDICAYLPKLKKDGYLTFHDYGCGMWTGVKQACDQAESENKIQFVTQSNRIGIFKLK